MLNFLPGIYQLENKQYFQGIFIFSITMLSILLLLRISFFQDNHPQPVLLIASAGVLLSAIIWHLFAIIHAKTSVPPVKDPPEKMYEKGRLALLKQNYELAEICFRNLLMIKPNDEDAVYQMGKTLIKLKKNREARELLKKYLDGKSKKWRNEIEDIYEEILKP